MKKILCNILVCIMLCLYFVPYVFAEEITDDYISDEQLLEDLMSDDVSDKENEEILSEIIQEEQTEQLSDEDDMSIEQTEEVYIKYEKEANILNSLGIMSADDYKVEITRGEFVAAVAKLCGYTGGEQSASTYFNDVPYGYPNEGAIAYAAGIKLVQGDGTNFRPDDGITLEQAGFVLLRALGYDSFSPYVTIDMAKAKQEGIYEGVSLRGNQILTFDDAAKVIYNAMNLEMILVRGTTSDGIGTATKLEKNGTTLLNYYLKIYMTEGRVTDNGMTTYDEALNAANNIVKIDNISYEKGNVDVTELLGHEVEAYYNEEETLLCVFDITKDRDVLYIKADDIISASYGSIQYENDNKVRTVSFSSGMNIIYNGKALKPGEYSDSILKPDIGFVKLIRTSGKDYDLIVIQSMFNCVVNSIHNKNGVYTFSDVNSAANNVVIDTDDLGTTVKISDADGNIIDCGNIAVFNVLSVARSFDGEYIDIKVSTEKTNGVVEGYSAGETITITLDGNTYTLAHGADTTYISVNVFGYLYFDIFGNAAYFDSFAKYEQRFAYLLSVKVTEDNVPGFMIKVFDPVGKVLTFTAPERIIADGVVIKDSGFDALAQSFYTGETFNPCMIRYELKLDGTLKSIDTCTYNQGCETEDTIRKIEPAQGEDIPNTSMFIGKRRYLNGSKQFDGQLFIDDDTLVFGIPIGEHGDEDYQMLSRSYFVNNRYYDVEMYTDDKDSDIAAAMIVRYVAKYDENLRNSRDYVILPAVMGVMADTGLVESIEKVVDDSGDIVHRANILDLDSGARAAYNIRWEDQAAAVTNGMIVRYLLMNNRIIDLEPVFDLNTRSACTPRILRSNMTTFVVRHNNRDLADSSTTEENTQIVNASWGLTHLDVLSLKGGMLKGVAGDAETVWPQEYYDLIMTSLVKNVYSYESKTTSVTLSDFEEILSYESSGGDRSEIVIFYENAVPRSIIILQ